jgi:hypothetical protein
VGPEDVPGESPARPFAFFGCASEPEAFADELELQEFLSLLMRHWNSLGRKLEEDNVFTPFVIRG